MSATSQGPITHQHYLDYAATTPVDPRVIEVMQSALGFEGTFANPGSVMHGFGQAAQQQLEAARARLAKALGSEPEQWVLSSGATESNNLAILGTLRQQARHGKNHLITQATEHKAVLDVAAHWKKSGGRVTVLPVDRQGALSLEALEAAITPDTALVSVMWVNNETGRVFPVEAIAKRCQARRVRLHVDAAQALGKVPMNLESAGMDYLSLTAGKAYGPKGVGALYRRDPFRSRLQPLCFGGGQESGIRPGTLATHQVLGLAEAAHLAVEQQAPEQRRLSRLRTKLWQALESALPKLQLNTPLSDSAANFLNLSVAGVEGEALLLGLRRVAVASGSACSTGGLSPSHVLSAMGLAPELAASSLRISLGRYTTDADIEAAIEDIVSTVSRLREMSAYE